MRSYIFIALVAAFALSSCKPPENPVLSSTKVNGNKIPVIHFENVEGEPLETNLSDIISDFEFICLETSAECLIQGAQRMAFYDDKLLVSTQRFPDPAPVFMFDIDGKFIKEVGKGGRGPGEHTGYMVVSVRKDRDIQINFQDKIQLFNNDGELLGELKEPMELCGDSYRIGDDLYFCPGSITGYPAIYRDSVMMVFHKQDGEILKSIPRLKYPPVNGAGYTPMGWKTTVYQYGDKWNIYMPSIDTLYSVNGTELQPRLIFDFGNTEQPYNEIADSKSLIGKQLYEIIAENESYWLFRNSELSSLVVNEYRPGRWSSQI
ncbi:MAG: 6-bladed beta-propeller, partial [Marinilabiliaceae bacterium]|nr:6-bladed beta-propeller [Marinilabiliaceae bacterium]